MPGCRNARGLLSSVICTVIVQHTPLRHPFSSVLLCAARDTCGARFCNVRSSWTQCVLCWVRKALTESVSGLQAVQFARDNPSTEWEDRSVHGGKSGGVKKKLGFFDLAKNLAQDSGQDFDSTFNKSTAMSRSRLLKDVSHHNTAANAIPKVRAEVRLLPVALVPYALCP